MIATMTVQKEKARPGPIVVGGRIQMRSMRLGMDLIGQMPGGHGTSIVPGPSLTPA
jgi:hypothetical protein